MAVLWNRAGHYIFALWFFLSSSSIFQFFLFSLLYLSCRRLDVYHTSTQCGLSANLGCRSETCCTWLTENTQDAKKSPKIRHLRTIAQLCRVIASHLSHISTIGKKLVKQQYLPPRPYKLQYGEL